jgi:hypothetical protein
MASRGLTFVALASCAALSGCAGYRAAPLDLERPLRVTVPAPFLVTFEEALRLAIERNPDLVGLRARATAVNVNPPPEPLEVGAGVDSDHRGEGSASLDALSLLGLGTRRADRALAFARRHEAWLAHHERVREVAREIAEVLAVDRALSSLSEPDLAVDASLYVRAGFESSVAESLAEATRSDWKAEVDQRAAERTAIRLQLVRLLGLPPGAAVSPAPVPENWPPVPDPSPAVLIRTRADVQRRVAAFEVADRQLRRAVVAQFPSVVLEPEIAADPTSLFGAVRLRLPVGAKSEVVAADAAREAARSEVESAVLDAVRDAGQSRARLVAAGSTRAATRRRLGASSELLRVGRTRLQVQEGSVIELVLTADAVVDAARADREAALEEARLRVRAASDAGWPTPSP